MRLQDNAALFYALKSSFPVIPLFIFDKKILDELQDKEDKRVNFIHQTLHKLNVELKENGASFLILNEKPLTAFKRILDSFNVQEVFTNHDYEPYAIKRDSEIGIFLSGKGIKFNTFKDQIIFERSEILKPDGSPYQIFTPYSKKWKEKYSLAKSYCHSSENVLNNFYKYKAFAFPSLSEIGFKKSKVEVPRLKIDIETLENYHKTRNVPALDGTSHAGIHLRFGTISIRYLAQLAEKSNETFLNELIWREFFMMILFHFPKVVGHNFKKKYDRIQWRNNEEEFLLWCRGETGYPIVDAGMRQLNETGQMHNRVRMVTASFLTKHLLIDWRWGEAYFAEKLLDYDLSSNNGNWQWAAGTGCDAAPYFRIFNPAEQIRKFDPELNYIKTWIKNFQYNYLPPIVEHSFARKRALEMYKKSLTS